jgi:hypothetical protein
MGRPGDHPLKEVRVSFEVTRLSRQHLIDAYVRLLPVIRRRLQARADGPTARTDDARRSA